MTGREGCRKTAGRWKLPEGPLPGWKWQLSSWPRSGTFISGKRLQEDFMEEEAKRKLLHASELDAQTPDLGCAKRGPNSGGPNLKPELATKSGASGPKILLFLLALRVSSLPDLGSLCEPPSFWPSHCTSRQRPFQHSDSDLCVSLCVPTAA